MFNMSSHQPVAAETDTTVASTQPETATASQRSKQKKVKARICRYYNSKKGCRAGDSCSFRHELDGSAPSHATRDDASARNSSAQQGEQQQPSTAEAQYAEALQDQGQLPNENAVRSAARVVPVQRPIPAQQAEDPRGFQISQVKKRYAATHDTGNGEDVLTFDLKPTDPDFPYDIDALKCVIRVPLGFPKWYPPSLRITNRELERGYQINVEQGFSAIWDQFPNPTLLNTLKVLDRRLEELLTAQKAEIIKIIANAGPKNAQPLESQNALAEATKARAINHQEPPVGPSAERVEEARIKREKETEMLEHRLGRDSMFSKDETGTIFTLPVEPRKRNELPVSIAQVKTVRLFVPKSYDIDPCTIELMGVEGEAAKRVEDSFARRVKQNKGATLLVHVNYLAQNMHTMAAQQAAVPQEGASKPLARPVETASATMTGIDKSPAGDMLEDNKSNLQYIPRPPEWSQPQNDDESTDDSDFTGSDESQYEVESEEDATNESTVQVPTSTPREKGILISLPHLELHGIELLELTTVNLTVKCERCKDTKDVNNVKNNEKGDSTGILSESCKKCAYAFGIGYRKDLMHSGSIRAGYLDLDGCTIVDLLPSNFAPTCSECSTTYPSPGVVSVRGDSSMALCRECHGKMVFRIHEVKFLKVGEAAMRATRGLPRKKPKENLGIVAGTPLPRNGRCTHYRRSSRSFRFSCCNKVFPCDKCHDKETDHPNEFANRMICGFCSREQNYRPENCGTCHAILTGKSTSGFWEGGKGTRDKARMSRKDPRKYKRTNPGTSNKK